MDFENILEAINNPGRKSGDLVPQPVLRRENSFPQPLNKIRSGFLHIVKSLAYFFDNPHDDFPDRAVDIAQDFRHSLDKHLEKLDARPEYFRVAFDKEIDNRQNDFRQPFDNLRQSFN